MTTEQQNQRWAKIPNINYEACESGIIRHYKSGKIKNVYDNGRGYQSFVSNNGGVKIQYVHRCVLMAFMPIDGMGSMQVNHIDFDRSNNQLRNLQWVTAEQNLSYSRRNGKYKKANKDHSQWMKENSALLKLGFGKRVVLSIQDTAILEFESQTACAKYHNVSNGYLCDHIRRNVLVNGHQIIRL